MSAFNQQPPQNLTQEDQDEALFNEVRELIENAEAQAIPSSAGYPSQSIAATAGNINEETIAGSMEWQATIDPNRNTLGHDEYTNTLDQQFSSALNSFINMSQSGQLHTSPDQAPHQMGISASAANPSQGEAGLPQVPAGFATAGHGGGVPAGTLVAGGNRLLPGHACVRCKAKKMRCDPDPIQCRNCQIANEECEVRGPFDGHIRPRRIANRIILGADVNQAVVVRLERQVQQLMTQNEQLHAQILQYHEREQLLLNRLVQYQQQWRASTQPGPDAETPRQISPRTRQQVREELEQEVVNTVIPQALELARQQVTTAVREELREEITNELLGGVGLYGDTPQPQQYLPHQQYQQNPQDHLPDAPDPQNPHPFS